MRLLIAVLVLVLVARAPTDACSCDVADIFERIETTPVIFLGETIAGGLEPGQSAWRGATNYARLRVIERFRGIADDVDEVEISLMFWQGMCAPMPYRRGARTLVFLSRDAQGKLRDGLCTASWFVDEDSEDLELVRGFFSGKSQTTIRGVVTENGEYPLWGRPIPNAIVIARSERGSFSSTTTEAGAFEIVGLPAGEYALHPQKTNYRPVGRATDKVKVRERGCATQMLGLAAQNSIAGAVFDRAGEPVAGVNVFLQHKDLRADGWGSEDRTNSKGEFRFEQIPPGPYYLVVSPRGRLPVSPFDQAIFGGASEKASTTPLDIQADSQLDGLNIFVGERYPTRKIVVRVQWPDGAPVDASIRCDDLTAETPGFPLSESGHSRDGQAASCTILGDRAYKIGVSFAPDVLPVQPLLEAREAVLPAGSHDVELEFVLSGSDYERSRMHRQRREELHGRIEEQSRQAKGKVRNGKPRASP